MKVLNSKTFSFSKSLKLNTYYRRINYKNIFFLRKYISIEGKILPRRLTYLNANQQRNLAKSIKTARIMGFLPFSRRIF